ncbi:MAG: hypothetical protein EA359_06720 [Balneolaceae bacterium]|nr:MAG: hypothetical protein EA359_06720 [Balneolaceae bacterium]
MNKTDTYHRIFRILIFFFFTLQNPLVAQISINSVNTGLGGGGTAYITGFEALFVNPANLYIQDKNYSLQISLLQGGYYFDSLLPITGYNDRFNRYRDAINHYDPDSNAFLLNDNSRNQVLERSFNETRLNGEFSTITDFYWLGIKWIRPERSYALSFRTRMASRYKMGRGFFTSLPNERNGNFLLDQSLRQRYEVLHEFSFGFAESFTFLNGLDPKLSEFIIGAAPKIVLAGSHIDASYTNRYEFNDANNMWNQNLGYRQTSSGMVSYRAEEKIVEPALQPIQATYSLTDLLQPSGIGAGLDIGITYLITFGDDLSMFRRQNEPTEKSLRLSFSVTDLGAVYHYKNPLTIESGTVEIDSSRIAPPADILYFGAPNEHLSFLNGLHDFQSLTQNITSQKRSYDTLLPLAVNTGGLLHYKRFKLMGDISYSIVQSAFRSSGFSSYLGIEVRPFQFLPIRGGTRLAPHLQGFYSLGTGIETNWFDLNASVLLKTRNNSPTSEILGASVVGIKFYL